MDRKEDINNHTLSLVSKMEKHEFSGYYVNRVYERPPSNPNDSFDINLDSMHESLFSAQYPSPPILQQPEFQKKELQETSREKMIRNFKYNTSQILHKRNVYIFFATVVEKTISYKFRYSDLIGFILIKILFKNLSKLRSILQHKVNILFLIRGKLAY